MPYIPKEDRVVLDKWIAEMPWPGEFIGVGALNYVITSIMVEWVKAVGKNYSTMKDVLGTLDAVGKEFYRRVVAPYEDDKRKEHGDVF